MAKDKGGHGSEKRYEVQVQPYSLAANKVGQHIGSPTVISRHNSLDAAGRVLGSMIRGNRQGEAQGIAGQGNGYKIGAVDKSTGAFIPRNQARTDIENAKPFSNVSGGQPVASNAHAAATLASGPKSASVDTHPAMSGGPRNAQGYRTTGTAYEGPRMPSMTSSGKRFNPNAGTGKFESFK